ncbi:MAG: hypothetical protein ACI4LO_02645 [Anaerovoracaceae bacterium]
MKAALAFIVCIVFLAPCIGQYALQTVNDAKMDRVESIVNISKEKARQEGYFTAEMIAQLKSDIEKVGFNSEDIKIEATEVPKYRTNSFDEREMIEYDVKVKIDKIIAGNKIFGISDEENTKWISFRGTVASEKLKEGV